MNRLLLCCCAALLLALPLTASAGGIVTDGRGGSFATVALFEHEGADLSRYLPQEPHKRADASLPPPPAPPLPLGDAELEQIHAGLITYEEASMGCGGSSSARGDASALGLLAVALGLVLRRARR